MISEVEQHDEETSTKNILEKNNPIIPSSFQCLEFALGTGKRFKVLSPFCEIVEPGKL